ncbi:unnamed protein product [Ceutorhynchus assimilis]|uniref:Lon N-terminal domain-containing protein n=1 Tax=Ceutorhynchus assimilis TaxID=467358 RepID=A0A9N9MBX9_9CUCU|nr:unnamed protein product [Ceutorhynchus assimilis]
MFAMLSMDPDGTKFVQYGTMLEVKDAVILQNGRIILSTQGVSRFKVISSDEKDGYDTAKVELVHDVVPDPEHIGNLIELHRKVHSRAVHWISILTPAALSEVERLIGPMPDVEDDWIHLPDGPNTFLEKRLRAIDKMLDHMRIRMEGVPKDDETVSYDINNEVFCSD